MVRRVSRAWDRYWFVEDSALNLAMARVLAAAVASWVLWSRDFTGVSALPAVFWSGTTDSTRWRFLLFPGHEAVESALLWTARVTALAAMAGLWPRLASFTTALLLYHLAPLESIVWTASPYGRGLTLPLLALLVTSAAPSGDALVIWPRPATSGHSWRGRSSSYGWPIRLVQLFLVQVYVFSAYGKLRVAGPGWGSAENLRNWLLMSAENQEIAVHRTAALWLSQHPGFLWIAGLGTLALEFGFLAALGRSKWRLLLVAGAIAFHAGIYFTMNITFNSWPMLLVFVDWDRRDA